MEKYAIIRMYYDEGNANGEIPKQIPLFCSFCIAADYDIKKCCGGKWDLNFVCGG